MLVVGFVVEDHPKNENLRVLFEVAQEKINLHKFNSPPQSSLVKTIEKFYKNCQHLFEKRSKVLETYKTQK